MNDLRSFGRTLVIAPHPDDEVLGAGGTIFRLSELGLDVFVAIVTRGEPPQFSPEEVRRVRAEARQAHRLLGVRETFWLNHPAANLSESPHALVNAAIGDVVCKVKPKTLFLPFLGDIHLDHQLTFLSSLVAARPNRSDSPRMILAYEALSETNWNAPYITPNFTPNVFIEIEESLEQKLKALKIYDSQLQDSPHERSLETVRALAMLRGSTIFRHAAEAFVLVRLLV